MPQLNATAIGTAQIRSSSWTTSVPPYARTAARPLQEGLKSCEISSVPPTPGLHFYREGVPSHFDHEIDLMATLDMPETQPCRRPVRLEDAGEILGHLGFDERASQRFLLRLVAPGDSSQMGGEPRRIGIMGT